MDKFALFFGIAAAALAAFASETPEEPAEIAAAAEQAEAQELVASIGSEAPDGAEVTGGNDDAGIPKSAAGVIRALLEETGVTFEEKRDGNRTEFTYHLSLDENSVEECRCTAAVEEGDFHASCWAVLPLTVPEDRLDDVAAALASWNGERVAGRLGLDFDKRAVYFVTDIPVESLAKKDPLLTLAFVGLPMLNLAEKDAAIRAVARGETLSAESDAPVAESDPPRPEETATEPGDGDPADETAEECAEECTVVCADEEPAGRWTPDIPTCDLVLRWITSRGENPQMPPSEPGVTTFQFNAGLGSGTGIFADATVRISVMENWVYALVSPPVRVPENARRKVSRLLLELSGKEDGVLFMWLPDGRVAARAVVPASLVDANPQTAVSGIVDRAGQALNRRSKELLAALLHEPERRLP
ncbi:MAG: hypothetical protein IJ783_00995 [Kiritimatiellae bacterium]|nr:hypothetical protein [Kiritimatiellia bacterium]